MRILFCINHPAHYHLCKNVIASLKRDGHEVFILARQKDVLKDLLINEDYQMMPVKKGRNIYEKLRLRKESEQFTLEYAEKIAPDFTTGTGLFSVISHRLHRPAYLLVEDDAVTNIMIFLSAFDYSRFTGIMSPTCCNNSFWNNRTVKYPSYHELAYLHPNHFTPDKAVVERYFSADKPYFILRFAQLNAYHDIGVSGINTEVAQRLIDMLRPHGDIYITSERPLEPQFEQYRIHIDPLDMHHVMAFAQLYIGDSQTMAAEAGVLGVPFVRFNDFVGKIGYLRELEDVYHLGFGIKPKHVDKLYSTVEELLAMSNRAEVFQQRRQKMLSEKIDLAKFLTWFIENYPESAKDKMDFEQFH